MNLIISSIDLEQTIMKHFAKTMIFVIKIVSKLYLKQKYHKNLEMNGLYFTCIDCKQYF